MVGALAAQAGGVPVPGAPVFPHGGASKAAIALVALGAEAAAEVLRHLPEAQAERLSAEMASLGVVDEAMLDSVCDELAALTGDASLPQGGIGFTRDVLERVVGKERADDLIRQFLGGDPKPFEFMRSMASEEVARLLEGESPQTIALVVSGVKPSMAARSSTGSTPSCRPLSRGASPRCRPPPARLLQDIDRGLREKVSQTR